MTLVFDQRRMTTNNRRTISQLCTSTLIPQILFVGLYPVYAWTFARAGLLLAPLIANSTESNPVTNPSVAAFCPAALQADYMDGLWTKSQRTNQAVGQCCLNDLFATLYWAWCRPSAHNSRCSSSDLLYPTGFSPKVPTISPHDIGLHDTHSLTVSRLTIELIFVAMCSSITEIIYKLCV